MRLQRQNQDLYDPIEHLNAIYIEAGKSAPKAWAALSEADLQFIVTEINHCLTDPTYYIANYHFIKPKKAVSVSPLYPLWDSQEMFLASVMKQFNKNEAIRQIVLKSRQLGLTTVSVALIFWLAVLHPHVHVLSMSDEDSRVDVNFEMARVAWENLEWWMRPDLRYNVKNQILGFDRPKGSANATPGMGSIIYMESSNQPSGAAYSKSLFGAHLAEVSRYRNSNAITEGVFGSLVNYSHSIGIMESTARGRTGQGATWHRIWKAAESGKLGWTPVFIEWFREPGYCISVPENFDKTQEEEAIVQKVKEELNYDLSNGQLAWRRGMMAQFEATDGTDEKWFQEFPLCVCSETLVSTELGIMRVDKAGAAKCSESGKITAWGPQPSARVFKLVTKMGRILRATGDHPIARADGSFTAISNLILGDEILLCPPMFSQNIYEHSWRPIAGYESKITIDDMWSYFIGFFMGGGSWDTGKLSIACDGKDEDVADFASLAIKHVLGRTPTRRIISRVQGRKGCIELRSGCVRANEPMLELGLVRRTASGKLARNVCVPDCIFRSPRNIIASFLRALFEWGASASNGCVRFGSCKVEFARNVQLLLLGFGINSRMSHSVKIAGNGNRYDFYALTLGVSASKIFFSEIGFISTRKDNALKEIVREKGKNGNRAAGHPPTENRMIDYVDSVIASGHEFTYDLTVEPTHVFSANGILTHNTSTEAFISSGRCAFSKKRLNAMITHFCRSPIWVGEIRLDIDNMTPKLSKQAGGRFWFWEHPNHKGNYYAAADPSMGIEDTGDPSCIIVYCVPEDIKEPIRQVARWHGWTTPTEFARILAATGYFYNTAECCPECNVVTTVASDLVHVLNYPRFYRWKKPDKIKGMYSGWIGFQTNWKNKNELIARFREALNDWTVVIRCIEDIDEMFDFVEDEPGSERFSAKGNSYDDACMMHLLAYYISTELRPRSSEPAEDKPAPDVSWANTEYSPIFDENNPEYQQDSGLPRYDEL